MADVSMNKFLLQFYMQRHFNKMPIEQFASFQDACKKDDLTKEQKNWKKNLVYQTTNGIWDMNLLPDPNDATGDFHLTDKEWEKLFKAFQNAFRAMHTAYDKNKDAFDDKKDAVEFMNEHFGDPVTHMFAYGEASNETIAEIATLTQLLKNDDNLRRIVQNNISGDLVEAKVDFQQLMAGMDPDVKKYNSDPKFRGLVQKLANVTSSVLYNSDALYQKYQGNMPDFQNITYNFEKDQVDPTKLNDFKGKYKNMLLDLYGNKKISDVFKDYDDSKITGPLNEAKTKVNYDKDSADYVPPKRDDQLTPWQQLKKDVGDTWTDYMDKYVKLRHDHSFLSPQAQAIFKALNSTNLKPTDGLAKIVEGLGGIEKNISSPTAMQHFKWFKETMTELKNDKNIKNLFAGALQNGRQMKDLVAEVCMKAIREGDKDAMDKAKTAMEVLYVLQYSHTTSKIMDAFKQADFTIFSDGKLSWNNDEGVKFVTNALDKSIKYAFLGIGYGITIIGNTINRRGRKFNNDLGRMRSAHAEWSQKNIADKTAAQADTNRDNAADQNTIANENAELARLAGRRTNITAANIGAKKTQLERLQNLETQRNNELTQKQQTFDRAEQAKDTAQQEVDRVQGLVDKDNKTVSDYNALQDSRRRDTQAALFLRGKIKELEEKIKDPVTITDPSTGLPYPNAVQIGIINQLTDEINQYKAHQEALLQQSAQKRQQLRAGAAEFALASSNRWATDLTNATNGLNTATSDFNTADSELQRAQRLYNSVNQRSTRLAANISKFDTATSRVQELTDRINKRNQKMADWDNEHKDKFAELMAHWDMLSIGDSRTPGSAKKKQKKMDALIQQGLLTQRYGQYGNVA